MFQIGSQLKLKNQMVNSVDPGKMDIHCLQMGPFGSIGLKSESKIVADNILNILSYYFSGKIRLIFWMIYMKCHALFSL